MNRIKVLLFSIFFTFTFIKTSHSQIHTNRRLFEFHIANSGSHIRPQPYVARDFGPKASREWLGNLKVSLLEAGNYWESVLGEQGIRVPVHVGIGNVTSGVDQTAATTCFTWNGTLLFLRQFRIGV